MKRDLVGRTFAADVDIAVGVELKAGGDVGDVAGFGIDGARAADVDGAVAAADGNVAVDDDDDVVAGSDGEISLAL